MALVYIPASLRPMADGIRRVELPGQTVREIIVALETQYPALAGRLREGDTLRPGLCVSIDSILSMQGLLQTVTPENEVHFLPTIGGG